LPEVKEKIIDMAMNGSGIRDTARVLKISPSTVINEIKKKESNLAFGSCSRPVDRISGRQSVYSLRSVLSTDSGHYLKPQTQTSCSYTRVNLNKCLLKIFFIVRLEKD
jgi:hypothetical protein